MLADPRDRLIVALDVPSVADAEALVARLGDAVTFYKIGYQLGFAGGLPSRGSSSGAGKQVFFDLKLHDIGNTVAQGVESVAQARRHVPHGACLSADHARRGRSARRHRVAHPRSDGADLLRRCRPGRCGLRLHGPELVAERAAQARDIGVDGLVCSAEEAAPLRPLVGRHAAGDARHPAGRRRSRRPEARHDARPSDRGRGRLPGDRPADPRRTRPESRRRRDRCGDRARGA